MAVKDGELYLRQAIDSILAQTLNDFELIIIDDYSSDSSVDIVQGYRDLRITHVKNDEHSGLTASLNRGLDLARGEYIARMDADDISLPGRFEEQVNFLDHHPDVAVLGTGIRFIDDKGNPIEDVIFPAEHELIKWNLCFYNPIAHPTVMMRTRVVRQAGGYDPELERSQDYDLWWRISSIGRLANLDEIYVQFRKHANQVTSIYQSGQFDAGLGINQQHLSELLGKRVTEDTIRKLWRKEIFSLDDALSVSQLIFEVFYMMDSTKKSKAQKQIITYDTLSMILPILLPYLTKIRVWGHIGNAICISPMVFIKVSVTIIAKFLNRIIRRASLSKNYIFS